MKIYIGADYRGFAKKQHLIDFLAQANYDVSDLGAYDSSENDFNDSAVAVAKEVREDLGAMGVLICDSAHGMTIQANRFKGIRAAHCTSAESAKLAREHDDANVLCMSAGLLDDETMREIIKTFLETKFIDYERRVRRINRLDEREDYD